MPPMMVDYESDREKICDHEYEILMRRFDCGLPGNKEHHVVIFATDSQR